MRAATAPEQGLSGEAAPAQSDVLVVRTSSTPGNRRGEQELIDALRELGVTVAVASSDYGLVGRLPMSLNLMDLTRAISLRHATTRALRKTPSRAIVYGTAGAALLEPADRLSRAAVRFDSLAADNRLGARHVVQRALERRMISRTRLLLPWSSSRSLTDLAADRSPPPIRLPTPVAGYPSPRVPRQPAVVCYAGAPEKKRLDLMIHAWAVAALGEPHRLIVTGIDSRTGHRWLSRRGIPEPSRVEWRGHLQTHTYRALTSGSTIFLSASRYEDYGIAQLEALADGAVCVTTASPGPYEALRLARQLDPRLVAEDDTPQALARALRVAAELTETERRDYRERAAALLEPFSHSAFKQRLAEQVLPRLLEPDPS